MDAIDPPVAADLGQIPQLPSYIVKRCPNTVLVHATKVILQEGIFDFPRTRICLGASSRWGCGVPPCSSIPIRRSNLLPGRSLHRIPNTLAPRPERCLRQCQRVIHFPLSHMLGSHLQEHATNSATTCGVCAQ